MQRKFIEEFPQDMRNDKFIDEMYKKSKKMNKKHDA